MENDRENGDAQADFKDQLIHPSIPTGLSWRHGTIQMGCRARETARYAARTLAEVPWFGGVAAAGG
jgi:hypothetical protein